MLWYWKANTYEQREQARPSTITENISLWEGAVVLKGQYIWAERASYNNREYFTLGGCCGTERSIHTSRESKLQSTERPISLDVSGSVTTAAAASIEIQADIHRAADQEEELEQEEDEDLHPDDLGEDGEDVDEDAAEGKNMCSSDMS